MEAANTAAMDIASLRRFNRVYTQRLGLLSASLDGSPFSLTEARILYELANRENPNAAEISRALSLDRGQLSRTLKRFRQRGLVESRASKIHGKSQILSLTANGRQTFAALNSATQRAVKSMLDH